MERTKETVSQEKVVGVSNHRRELRSVKFVVRFGYMKHIISALLTASLVLAPTAAFASFYDSTEQARSQVNSLSRQQLDALNARVFTDAFLTAKIIGYDRTEFEQLKADVRALKEENAQLRALLSSQPATVAQPVSSALESRVDALEGKLISLQSTLGLVVNMLTTLLSKLQ